jgi:hypothetical protein
MLDKVSLVDRRERPCSLRRANAQTMGEMMNRDKSLFAQAVNALAFRPDSRLHLTASLCYSSIRFISLDRKPPAGRSRRVQVCRSGLVVPTRMTPGGSQSTRRFGLVKVQPRIARERTVERSAPT